MRRAARDLRYFLFAATILATACGGEERPAPGVESPGARAPQPGERSPAESAAVPPVATAVPHAEGAKVVFLGDSLTAGYGLAVDEAYPALVEKRLAAEGVPIRAINAGVSGDTSAGGLERLDWLLAQRPAIVVLCLGGNDGLRGLPLESTEANLRAIVERAKAAGAEVVLAGMQIPPNYGPEYTAGFRALYPRLANEYGLTLVPFLLEGVAARPELNQRDGIHPNAEGQKIVARTVAAALAPLLRDRASAT